jgi:endogenous inhibitor of DNA gyrase (YacG/DUF329 family)
MENDSIKQVHCPTCKKTSTWLSNNPYRPFCSDRCKLIDLGDWASEKHRVAGEEISKEDDNSEDET